MDLEVLEPIILLAISNYLKFQELILQIFTKYLKSIAMHPLNAVQL